MAIKNHFNGRVKQILMAEENTFSFSAASGHGVHRIAVLFWTTKWFLAETFLKAFDM